MGAEEPSGWAGAKSPQKILDPFLWVSLKLGPEKAIRVLRRARSGDPEAQGQFIELFEELLKDLPGAMALLEDHDVGDAVLSGAPSTPRPRVRVPSGQRSRGRPPRKAVATLFMRMICGEPSTGRPRRAGGLDEELGPVRDILARMVHAWRRVRAVPALSAAEVAQLALWLPSGGYGPGIEDVAAEVDAVVDGLPFAENASEADREVIGALLGLAGGEHKPPDFKVEVPGTVRDFEPRRLSPPGRSIFWQCVASSLPARKAAYAILAEISGLTIEGAQRAAGSGGRLSDTERWTYVVDEAQRCRVIIEDAAHLGPTVIATLQRTAGAIAEQGDQYNLRSVGSSFDRALDCSVIVNEEAHTIWLREGPTGIRPWQALRKHGANRRRG